MSVTVVFKFCTHTIFFSIMIPLVRKLRPITVFVFNEMEILMNKHDSASIILK